MMTGPILRLTSAQTTKPVYVNFARVGWFFPERSGGTWLGLAADQGVSVQETPEQIVERLGDTDSVWVGVEQMGWLERRLNGGREFDLNDMAMGCLLLQIAGPALLIGAVLGAACGRLVR